MIRFGFMARTHSCKIYLAIAAPAWVALEEKAFWMLLCRMVFYGISETNCYFPWSNVCAVVLRQRETLERHQGILNDWRVGSWKAAAGRGHRQRRPPGETNERPCWQMALPPQSLGSGTLWGLFPRPHNERPLIYPKANPPWVILLF